MYSEETGRAIQSSTRNKNKTSYPLTWLVEREQSIAGD